MHVQGEDTPTPVAARVIGSLTGDLAPKLEAGVFQPELYYLLTPLRLSLPPLRTRPDDLNQAIDMCLDDCVVKFNRYVVLTREARRLLMDYPWPGNYIQLRAFLERMVLTAPARTDGQVSSQAVKQPSPPRPPGWRRCSPAMAAAGPRPPPSLASAKPPSGGG